MIQNKKKVYYLGVFLAIVFLCLGIGIFCLLFIGGTSTIITDTGNILNRNNNNTKIYDFLLESSGFAMLHHIKNFYLAFYFTTSNIYKISYPTNTKILLHEYGSSIYKTLGWAALWEIVEKFVVFMFQLLSNTYPENVTIIFFSDWIGTGEVVYNSLLSDLPQAIFACTGLCVLIYFIGIVVPSKILIDKKPIIIIILQFAWIGLSGICGFSIIYKKKTDFGIIPVGFYAYFFIELFFICTLYLGDFYYIKTNVMFKNLIESYLIFVLYLIIQWAAAFNLYAPGFITSNVLYVAYILFLLSIWKKKI